MMFLNATKFYRADAFVLGGDIAGNTNVPIGEPLMGLAPQAFQVIELLMTFQCEIQGDKFE
jgi:hypothetical protein